LLEPLDEVGAGYKLRTGTRDVEFGEEERITLDAWPGRSDSGGIRAHGWYISRALSLGVEDRRRPFIRWHLILFQERNDMLK